MVIKTKKLFINDKKNEYSNLHGNCGFYVIKNPKNKLSLIALVTLFLIHVYIKKDIRSNFIRKEHFLIQL